MPKLVSSPSAAERIMLAAQGQFLTHGFGGTSIDRIARDARVGKNSLYALYAGKDALFEAVVDGALERVREAISRVGLKRGDPQTVLRNYGQGYFSAVISPEGTGLYRATISAGQEYPTLMLDLRREWVAVSGILASYLADLQAQGVIAPLDLELLAFRFVSCAVDGARYACGFAKPSEAAARRIVQSATSLFLHGYSAVRDVPISDDIAIGGEAHSTLTPYPRAAIRMSFERMQGLLDSARQEFFENGFHGANLDRVAKQAGVSKATMFRHFDTKSGLFRYVVLREAQDIWGAPPAFDFGLTLEETLQSLVANVLDRHLHPRSQALHASIIAESGQFPALTSEVAAMMREGVAGSLRRCLMAFGWPMPGVFASRVFFTLATDGVRWIGSGDAVDAAMRQETVNSVVDIFLKGICVD